MTCWNEGFKKNRLFFCTLSCTVFATISEAHLHLKEKDGDSFAIVSSKRGIQFILLRRISPLGRKLTLLRCVSKKSRIIFLPLLHHFGNEKRIGKVSKWVFCQRGLSNDNFSNYAFEAGGILLRVYPSSYGLLVQFLFSLQESLSTVRPVISLGLTFPFNGCDHGIWKVPKVHFFYKIIFNQNIWHCCWYILETSRQSGCKLWRYKRTSAPFFDPIFVAFSISPWMSQYIFRHLSPSQLFGVCYDIWSTSHPREWNEDFLDIE